MNPDYFTPRYLLRLMTAAPKAFWRFDIDLSLAAAAQMARFATLAGVQGVFYVLACGEFYNPFSPSNRATLMGLATGHRLGLHCDYGHAADGDVAMAVRRQAAAFEVFYPGLFLPGAVSFHMPAPDMLWRDWPTFNSAYAARWHGQYVSDSRREWDSAKEDRVLEAPDGGEGLQVALHAEHWFA